MVFASGRGDLYITVKVETPRDKSEREGVERVRRIMREFGVGVALAKRIEERILAVAVKNARYADTLENRNARLGQEVERLKNENARLRAKANYLDQSDQKIRDLTEEARRLKNENARLKTKANYLDRATQELISLIAKNQELSSKRKFPYVGDHIGYVGDHVRKAGKNIFGGRKRK